MTFPRPLVPGMAARLFLALALALIHGQIVHATTVQRMALPEMVQQAEDVAQVRVLENRVRTDPDTLYHWTVTTFEVLDPAKGRMRPGEIFEVEVIGGEAPGSGYATVVSDAPRFSLGEEVVLFTTVDADGRRQPVGFFQGAVRLRPGAHGLETVSLPFDGEDNLRPAPATRAVPLRRSDARPAPRPGAGAAHKAVNQKASTARPTLHGNRRALTVEQLLTRVRELSARAEGQRP